MILSIQKSNSLFWLGRYAERGYHLLHLMRRAYDEVLDVPVGETPESNFLAKLHAQQNDRFTTSREMMAQLYNRSVETSLISICERMMDNAIVLRPEIKTESFSYIELVRDTVNNRAQSGDDNITNLQPVTDYLLAFWGSILERVFGRSRTLLMAGKYIEQSDTLVRFDYDLDRVKAVWEMLRHYFLSEAALFDNDAIATTQQLLAEKEEYSQHNMGYKRTLLNALGRIAKI